MTLNGRDARPRIVNCPRPSVSPAKKRSGRISGDGDARSFGNCGRQPASAAISNSAGNRLKGIFYSARAPDALITFAYFSTSRLK